MPVNAVTNYLEKLGSNFLVASMIPSFGLVVACLLVFDPILGVSSGLRASTGFLSLLDISIWVIIPTVIIGYTLTALNTLILKIFEGYVLLHRFPFMRNGYARKAQALIDERERVRHHIQRLAQKKLRTVDEEIDLNNLQSEYYNLVVEYDQHYPPQHAGIMPTRFGNILKASEAYSGTRYGIDGVQFWPRLWHVIPENYRQAFMDARNELSFLVNMSTLSVVFYLLCIAAILFNAPVPGSSPNWDLALSNSLRYLIAGTIAFIANWFFNRAALFSVGDFGMMIRSAYDLFRLDLLEQLRLKLPRDYQEENAAWQNIGELIVLGQEATNFTPFEYQHKKQE